jgi:hypothetical protein
MARSLFAPLADSLLPILPFTYLGSLLLCGAILSTLVPGYSWTDLPLPIPNSHHPRSIVRPTKTTSRSWLHMVRNSTYSSLASGLSVYVHVPTPKFTFLPVIAGMYKKSAFICLLQTQNNWKSCFMYAGLSKTWNPAGTVYGITMTVYFLPPPPPPFTWLIGGKNQSPQFWWSDLTIK